MLKNLPHNSADVIKSHIDLLMNGDSSPAAIARQQEVVDAADKEYQQYKNKSGQSADLGAKLTEEQSKLAMMKIGSLSQAHADLVNAVKNWPTSTISWKTVSLMTRPRQPVKNSGST